MTPEPKPTEHPWGTCDWGTCDNRARWWRWENAMKLWLPVCEKHRHGR